MNDEVTTEEIIAQDTQVQDMQEEQTASVFESESVDSILQTLNGNDITITPPMNNVMPATILSDYVDSVVVGVDIAETTNDNYGFACVNVSEATDTPQQSENIQRPEVDTESYIIQVEDDFNKNNEIYNESESRFSGAEWYERVKSFKHIIIAGIGGIGSWTSLLISRLHPKNISIFDNDTVELVNLSGQLFSRNNAGSYKCRAMRDMIMDYSDYYDINVFNELYTGQITSDIMICGFDNMAARKLFFDSWCNHIHNKDIRERKECLYLDARLGLEELQIFAIRGDEDGNIFRYHNDHLFSDSEAEQVPCSMKQTSFMASMVGSLMTNILVNFATNIDEPMDVRTLPFLTLYNASDMRLQVKY